MGYLIRQTKPCIIELDRGMVRKIETLLEWMDTNPEVWNKIRNYVYSNKLHQITFTSNTTLKSRTTKDNKKLKSKKKR
jgi:hypothetical protein